MRLGVTGTRFGWSEDQNSAVFNLLGFLKPNEVHHGNCVGVDEQFAMMCFDMKMVGALPYCLTIVCHPPLNNSLSSTKTRNDIVLKPKTYLARNRDIVDASESMIVVPFEDERQPSGGTWYTYDYAQKNKKWAYLILRDGTIRLDCGWAK